MKEIPTTQVGIREPCHYRFDMRPRPKERPRSVRVGNRIVVMKSKTSREYELLIEQMTDIQHPLDRPLEGDLIATVSFYIKNRVHGDLDNLLKSILDGMQGVAFKNDKQIRGFNVHVYYFDEIPESERIERTEVILTHRRKPNLFEEEVDEIDSFI